MININSEIRANLNGKKLSFFKNVPSNIVFNKVFKNELNHYC
jgi:hypothetical protein